MIVFRTAVLACALGVLTACGGHAPPLLLLVSVDTLRADRLGAYGGPEGLTPHIDELLARSLVFERAYAVCAYTLPSMAALHTGRYPEEVGLRENVSTLDATSGTLAEVLQLNGWRTGAVVSNFLLRPKTGLSRGFEIYDARFPQREANREMPERIATRTTDDALAVLDRLREEPAEGIFLWVHYQDPHGPYTPPGDLRERYLAPARAGRLGGVHLEKGNFRGLGKIPDYQYIPGEDEAAFYLAGYHGEIAYLDREIGRLLEGIDARGALEGATVVFTADHGEGLGERDYWFAHGEYLMDALVRVPLAIRLPGRAGERRRDVAALIDLMPTLLTRLGIRAPISFPGRDLLAKPATGAARPIYLATLSGSSVPRRGLIQDGYKYVATVRRDGTRSERLVRLGADEDDLAQAEGARLEAMRGGLQALVAGLSRPQDRRQTLSPEEIEQLRRLGYVVD